MTTEGAWQDAPILSTETMWEVFFFLPQQNTPSDGVVFHVLFSLIFAVGGKTMTLAAAAATVKGTSAAAAAAAATATTAKGTAAVATTTAKGTAAVATTTAKGTAAATTTTAKERAPAAIKSLLTPSENATREKTHLASHP